MNDFQIKDGTLLDYTGKSSTVIVPHGVKKISACTFSGNDLIKEVVLPEGLMEIGISAFEDCTALTHITLPQSLSKIEWDAFLRCDKLASIELPEGLSYIGENAFAACGSLPLTRFGDCLYLGNTKNPYLALVRAAKTDITALTVHENTKFILDHALAEQAQLKTLSLPYGLTDIGNGAFESCAALTEVIIPGTVQRIGRNTFEWCENITEISLPEGILHVEESAFSLSSLRRITLPDSLQTVGWSAFPRSDRVAYHAYGGGLYFGNPQNPYAVLAFTESKELSELHLHPDTKIILDTAARDLKHLKTLTIPCGVRYIGQDAFRQCTALTEVTIPESVHTVADGAFCSCKSLRHLSLPTGQLCIGEQAFGDCTALTDITLPSCTIDDYAFNACTALEAVHFQGDLDRLGDYAFSDCTALSAIALPTGLAYIGEAAFSGCESLEKVTLSRHTRCDEAFDDPDGITFYYVD